MEGTAGQHDLLVGVTVPRYTHAGSPTQDLAAVHRAWGLPSEDHLRWLLESVPESALWPIGGARVTFSNEAFRLDEGGADSITFRAMDRDAVADLIAWRPESGELASWTGAAFCLGDYDDISNPATYFDGGSLLVHREPLSWLRASREGIVVVRPELIPLLRTSTRITCADYEAALDLERQMVPRATAQILIPATNKDDSNGR